jgi:hypothetical protein
MCLYMLRAPCAHGQKVKSLLYSIWYHHTETSEWSKITKTEFYKYEQIIVKFMYEFFGYDYCILLTVNILFITQFLPSDDVHIMLETCRGI